MMPDLQASRRASPAEIRCPVSRAATPIPDSASIPIVTTSVNGDPFTLGISLRWFSSSSMRPWPSTVLCGSVFPVAGSRRPSPTRRGLGSDSSAFFSSCACSVGSLNRPSLVPSPWSRTEKCASARALPSSFSSFLPSATSAASGHTTSKSRLPICLRVGASKRVASSIMCASAASCVPGGRSSYSVVRDSTAAVMMPAFVASMIPDASAARVAVNRSSSFLARCRSR